MVVAQTTIELVRPELYPKQEQAIFCPERYAIVEASSKSGKTHGCIAWLLERAFVYGAKGTNHWWIAPVHAQARIAYQRIKRALFAYPTLYQVNETQMTVVLANGATLAFKGSDRPDTLYGDDVYDAVIDEASRCREEAWHAVRSTLTATRGRLRIIGNVKGRKNWAYRMARRAEAGEPDMHYAKITAFDAVAAGVLDAREIEDARRQLPENVFRELYLAEPSDDGGNPFGIDAIARCAVLGLSSDPPVCFGVDLAKSVDWNVIIGLDADGYVCRNARWQGPWEMTMERIRSIVGTVPCLVDSTGVGDPVLEMLQKGKRNYEGWKFTAPSKQQLMEGLAVAIQQQEVFYPDGVIRSELESFEYVYSRTGVHYSAPEGLHDDCVCALALAWQHHRKPPKRVTGQRTAVSPPRQQIVNYVPR